MKLRTGFWVPFSIAACLLVQMHFHTATAQEASAPSGPDPREIPMPVIKTPMGTLPGVNELPVRKELPDIMLMNGGTKVTNRRQWEKRREEIKRVLAYYAIGQ